MSPRDFREKTTVPVSTPDVAREVARARGSLEIGGRGVAYRLKLQAADIADPELAAQLKEQIDNQIGDPKKIPPFVSKGIELAVPALVSLAQNTGGKGARELEIIHNADGKIHLGVRDGETSHTASSIEGPAAPLEN
jgi:hypothetical protein